jgi:hypothetical protein
MMMVYRELSIFNFNLLFIIRKLTLYIELGFDRIDLMTSHLPSMTWIECEWVGDCCSTPAKWAIFLLLYGENKRYISMRWWWYPLCTRAKRIFAVLVHWKNTPRGDMSVHSDALSWFRANQSLLLLLNDVCLAEKQQIPIL